MKTFEYKVWVPAVVFISLIFILANNPKTESSELLKKEIKPETLEIVDIYDYSHSVISSMSLANEAKDILSDMSNITNPNDIYTSTMATLIALRKASGKLRQAARTIENYTSTTDTLINENSEHYQKTYLTLSALLETSALENEGLLKSQDENGLTEFISSSSKTAVALDETWKLIPLITAELAHAMVDTTRLVNGNVQYLKINKAQRKELIGSLDGTFGSEIKNGIKTGQLAIVASGAMLREFLTKDWLSSDE